MKKTNWIRSASSILLTFVITIALFAAAAPVTVEAATAYKQLNVNKTTKVGSWYFKISNDKIYYSKNKSTGYKAAKFKGTIYYPDKCFTDGATILTVEDTGEASVRLASFDVTSGKYTMLKKLSTLPTASLGKTIWYVSAVYGSNVYLTRFEYFGHPQVKTYVYNLSAKSFKAVKSNCEILARSGKYFIATNSAADTFTHKITLYKTNSSGTMTVVKTLGKYIGTACFIGGDVYYAKYPETTDSTVSIYRCTRAGDGLKKLATIKGSSNSYGSGTVVVNKITADYCEYDDWNSGSYRYYYSSKKKVSI